MKTYCVVMHDPYNDYPIAVITTGKTRNDATAIAVEAKEKGDKHRFAVVEEQT